MDLMQLECTVTRCNLFQKSQNGMGTFTTYADNFFHYGSKLQVSGGARARPHLVWVVIPIRLPALWASRSFKWNLIC